MLPKWFIFVFGFLVAVVAWISYFLCVNIKFRIWTTNRKKLISWSVFLGAFVIGCLIGIPQMSRPIVRDSEIITAILTYAVCGILLGIIGYKVLIAADKAAENNVQQEKIRKEIEAEQLHQEKIRTGSWVFPSMVFYSLCKESNVNPADSSMYAKEKCKKLAEYILEKNRVPVENRQQYFDKLPMYYQNAEHQIQTQKDAEELYNHTVQKVQPSQEEQAILDSISSLRRLSGLEKRRKMLQNSIDSLEIQIQDNLNYCRQLSTNNTAPYVKEKNWAALGGMASAIAGPAAGVVTALNAQAENEKIRETNALYTQATMYLNAMTKQTLETMRQKRAELERKLSSLQKELDMLPTKIVFDSISSREIEKHTSIRKKSIKKTDSGILEVNAVVQFNLSPAQLGVPNGVVDGFVHGKVFSGDCFVDDICFVLPMEGVSISKEHGTNIQTYCTAALPVDADYSIELSEESCFWIMEK